MKVDVQGLINQLTGLAKRLDAFRDKIDELEESGEETIELYKIHNIIQWYDTLNIEIACDGLKQAYLDEEGNEKDESNNDKR